MYRGFSDLFLLVNILTWLTGEDKTFESFLRTGPHRDTGTRGSKISRVPVGII
jgi:hypothetical protein